MEPMSIEDMLTRMAELEKSFKPLLAKARAEKEEYSQLEQAIQETAISEELSGENKYEHGVVKVNSGRPALVLVNGRFGSASWEEVVTKLIGLKLNRFLRIKKEPIKNRIKDEMSGENMKKIGVAVVTEPSVSVEVF
jgi:hypothetical protein